MQVRFKSPASRELDEAYRWYEQQEPGGGGAFIAAFDRTIERISMFPESCPREIKGARCATILRFPYRIWYTYDGERINLYAVAHTGRKADYWIRRIE